MRRSSLWKVRGLPGAGAGAAVRSASAHSSEVPKPRGLALSLTPSLPPALHAIHQQILGAPASKDILNLTISFHLHCPHLAQVSIPLCLNGCSSLYTAPSISTLVPHPHASQSNPFVKCPRWIWDTFCHLAQGLGPMSISGAVDHIYKRCHHPHPPTPVRL